MESTKLLASPANTPPAAAIDIFDNLFVIIISIFVLTVLRNIKLQRLCKRKSTSVKAKRSPFIEVEEMKETIVLYYEPAETFQYVNGVRRTIPTNRWSYEATLTNLAAYRKHFLTIYHVSTQEHMEHIEKMLESATHFKVVGFVDLLSPMNQQIFNLVKTKAIQKENNNIRVNFVTEFNDNESQLFIQVESNGFCIDCQLFNTESIAYSQLLNFLKEVANKNQIVSIELDGPEFKDLFIEIGWQFDEDEMEKYLTNGVSSNIRLLNDSNVYTPEIPYGRVQDDSVSADLAMNGPQWDQMNDGQENGALQRMNESDAE